MDLTILDPPATLSMIEFLVSVTLSLFEALLECNDASFSLAPKGAFAMLGLIGPASKAYCEYKLLILCSLLARSQILVAGYAFLIDSG